MSSLARTFSSPFNSKAAQGARKFMSLQASNASAALTNEFQELFKERTISKKRRKIVREIIESEKSYQQHLQLLIQLFLVPIKVGCILPKAAIEAIFGNIEGIWSVNLQLLELMETEDVVSALYKLAPFMKLYSLYANNFEKSSKTIEEQEKKNPNFVSFKESQEDKEEMQGLKLRALLITPIQRIPRYKLLLETLLEKTVPDHPDYKKLRDACAEVANVASHINECLRLHENFNKMLTIQNSLVGDSAPRILAPGRTFLREGMLSKVCKRGGSTDRMFFLFNDILIYAKKETACTYTCRGVFPLINCMVEQVMGGTTGPTDGGALFKIFCKGKTLLLFSTSKQNARSWVKDIKNAISELHTNLASLRRGDTDPFTPPDAAFKRDSKMRRSKAGKELLRKNETLSPFQQLRNCTSPKQDILYPMRKDILPQLAENLSYPAFDAYERRPKIHLQSCLNSGKKEQDTKPRLRRLHLDDSVAKVRKGGWGKEKASTETSLRESRKRSYDALKEKITNSPNIFRGRKTRSQNERLIQRLNSDQDESQWCFGSAKKTRSSAAEEYCLCDVDQRNESLVAATEEKIETKLTEKQPNERNETKLEDEEAEAKLDEEVTVKSYYKDSKVSFREKLNTKDASGNGSKTWSLTDDTPVPNMKQRKGIIYQTKSKILRRRRKKRLPKESHRQQTGDNTKSEDNPFEQEENTSLLFGTVGTFKSVGTPIRDLHADQVQNKNEKAQTCTIM